MQSRSISLRYVSMPSQTGCLESTQSSSLLASLCVYCDSFGKRVQSVVVRQPSHFHPLFVPQFSDNYTNLGDHPDDRELYIIRENLTTGTPLPP